MLRMLAERFLFPNFHFNEKSHLIFLFPLNGCLDVPGFITVKF
uniref:Uncharacterized protein n=1 Tax=Anguilla anguilla TaxID=7936 RepID=A0A0E9QXZ5_ANGAN